MGIEWCFWVETSNAQIETGHYSLRGIRAGGSWIGNKSVVLGPNQSASTQSWGNLYSSKSSSNCS